MIVSGRFEVAGAFNTNDRHRRRGRLLLRGWWWGDGWLLRQNDLLAPVGLQEDAIDAASGRRFSSGRARLRGGTPRRKVAGAAARRRRPSDERTIRLGASSVEGRAGERHLVELGADEVGERVGREFLHQDRVGDAVLDVLVHGQREPAEQLRLRDEDEAVVLGEILEE
jgi:hypothetical protein